MNRTNHVIKSEKLGKDMNVRMYGTKGYPIIAFPTQDQMADEWETNGMTEVFAPYVDDGRVQLFTVDSNDLESWSNPSDDFAARIARQEDYYDFVCEELLPFVHETNNSRLRPELTGASLGATQATICALRRPDLFQGVIALSGMYHTSYFFGDWGNDVSYANDVNAFLPNTPADHPYIELYRHRTFAFSIGQAPDEQFGVDDLHFLQQTFDRLGISGWFDFWGPESNHDWYWWKQQMGKFLPEAVKELEGVAAAEPELTKPAAKRTSPAKAVKEKAETKVSETKSAARAKVEATHKATKAAVKKVEQKATAAARKAEDEAHEAEQKAKAAVAQTTKKAEEKATQAKAKAEAKRVRAEAGVAKAQAKVEAQKEKAEERAEAVKTSAKATAKAAQDKAEAKSAAAKEGAAKVTSTVKAGAKKATSARKATSTKTTKASGTKATTAKASTRTSAMKSASTKGTTRKPAAGSRKAAAKKSSK